MESCYVLVRFGRSSIVEKMHDMVLGLVAMYIVVVESLQYLVTLRQ